METESVLKIKDLMGNIKSQLDNNSSSVTNELYGREQEYTTERLFEELETVLRDLSDIISPTQKFLTISTYKERSDIGKYLMAINNYFSTPQSYFGNYETLKSLLRTFKYKNATEYLEDFDDEFKRAQSFNRELSQELSQFKINKIEIEKNIALIKTNLEISNNSLQEINNDLSIIVEKKNELYVQTEILEQTNNKLLEIKDKASETLNEIFTALTESKSNEKLISSYTNRITHNETKLLDLENAITAYSDKIKSYDEERSLVLEEANNLITSAKEALNYKTAEGISASFQEQYISANNRWVFGSWIFGAAICLALTVGLGIWILNNATDDIILVISRISLMPLPIIGTIFCANQYTRQKNIIEDYAYKMVLSKAIVGFSEQLKKHGSENNDEYVHYIKTALKEIHKDPLRKREKQKSDKGTKGNLNELIEVAERIVKIAKP